MALTDKKISALQPKEKRYLVTDGRGLGLEVFPSGVGSWRFRYRLRGKLEKVVLGQYPDVSLAAARAKRDELAGQVFRGQSPAREKQLEKMAMGNESTVREFAERYYTDVVLRSLKDPSAARRYLDKQILPAFGNKVLKDVTAADVQTLVLRKRDNGQEAAAAAIRNLIKRLFDYAIVRGAAQVNPALALPMRFITKARSRTRTLSPDEIRVYLRSLYESNIRRQFKIALHLILLTLVRKSELLFARWDDVDLDLDSGEWQVPAENSKTRKPHVVYLSRQAAELFRELKPLAGDSEWVLPSRSCQKRPFAHNALNQALVSMSLPMAAFTIHDLRRTGSTLLHEKGFPSDVVEKALNHTIGGVRGVYNKAEYSDQRREMLRFWGDYIESLMTERKVLMGRFGVA